MAQGYQPALCSEYIHMNCESIENALEMIGTEVKKFPFYLIPQIGLSMTAAGEIKGANFEDRVAAGEYDTQIASLCRGIKDMDRPVFLRIGYEFNGRWNGYKPDPYKKAFVRIDSAYDGYD